MLFLITKETKAIYLCDTGYYRSKVLEDDQTLCSVRYPTKLINDSCLKYDSSLEGREEAVKKILNTKSKLPIPVDPNNGIYMFPTLSKQNKNCVWLAYYHIANYQQVDERALVTFVDGTSIYANVSITILDLQFKRTSQVIAQQHRDKFF